MKKYISTFAIDEVFPNFKNVKKFLARNFLGFKELQITVDARKLWREE